jgi:hypothetical protein
LTPKTGLVKDVNESALPPWTFYWDHYKKGTWRDVVASRCGVPAMKGIYDERFPPSEMKIPDQIRAEAFWSGWRSGRGTGRRRT